MAKNAKLSISIALCGVMSALSVSVMFAALIPSLAYAVPAAAGIAVYIVGEQLGKKWAYLSYITVALLSFILVPEIEADFFFLTLFGYYPTLRSDLQRIKNKLLRFLAKLAVFNIAVVITYRVLCLIVPAEQLLEGMEDFGAYAVYVLWASGNVAFVLYDFFLNTVRELYAKILRPKLNKLMKPQ